MWVAPHVRRMSRLLPLPALHGHAPPPPEVDQLLHGRLVAQGVVFTEEEEGRRGDGVVVKNLDAVVVEVCCVGLEEPEVKHGCVFHEVLEAWNQSLTKA